LFELLKNEFPWIPEIRTHGGGVCYMVRLTDITTSRIEEELLQAEQAGQAFKWYRVEDCILCAYGMKP
jgi:hypothetical protein